METITIEIPQKLKEDYLKYMRLRLIMKDLHPVVSPAYTMLILVAKALEKGEDENH